MNQRNYFFHWVGNAFLFLREYIRIHLKQTKQKNRPGIFQFQKLTGFYSANENSTVEEEFVDVDDTFS